VKPQFAIRRLVMGAVVMPLVRYSQRVDDAGNERRVPKAPARRIQEAEVERGVVQHEHSPGEHLQHLAQYLVQWGCVRQISIHDAVDGSTLFDRSIDLNEMVLRML
jgi:hypothetical protein